MVDYERFICGRARVEGVEYEAGRWHAVVCSWFGSEKACVRVDVTGIVDPLVREEARRIAEERCAGDEECEETYWDIFLEEAAERIAEGRLAEIAVKDHEKTVIEQACPDLVGELAPKN